MAGLTCEEGHDRRMSVVDVVADEDRRALLAACRPSHETAVILLDDQCDPAVRVISLPADTGVKSRYLRRLLQRAPLSYDALSSLALR